MNHQRAFNCLNSSFPLFLTKVKTICIHRANNFKIKIETFFLIENIKKVCRLDVQEWRGVKIILQKSQIDKLSLIQILWFLWFVISFSDATHKRLKIQSRSSCQAENVKTLWPKRPRTKFQTAADHLSDVGIKT